HADAVALAQTAEEVLLGPGEFKAGLLGLQDLRHIAADHPADVDAHLFLFRSTSAHDGLLPSASVRKAPSVGSPRFRRSGWFGKLHGERLAGCRGPGRSHTPPPTPPPDNSDARFSGLGQATPWGEACLRFALAARSERKTRARQDQSLGFVR